MMRRVGCGSCSVANSFRPRAPPDPLQPSEVVAFESEDRQADRPLAVPGGGTCNDIAISAATARPMPPIRRAAASSRLPKGRRARWKWSPTDDRLKGIDGLAFAADGADVHQQCAEAGNVASEAPGGSRGLAVLTKLNVDVRAAGSDGLRPIGGNRFLQAEGTAGRVTLVTITRRHPRRWCCGGPAVSPGITLVGDTVCAIEGKINYLIDPAAAWQGPGPVQGHRHSAAALKDIPMKKSMMTLAIAAARRLWRSPRTRSGPGQATAWRACPPATTLCLTQFVKDYVAAIAKRDAVFS